MILFNLSVYVVAAIFLLQLVVISLYVSNHWRTARYGLFQRYPEETFANLYANSFDVEKGRLQVRKWLDYGIVCSGFVFLSVAISVPNGKAWLGNGILLIGALQWIPILISYYWCRDNTKIMSVRHPEAVRKASMVQHNLFGFLSVLQLSMVVFGLLFANGLGIVLYFFANEQGSVDKIWALVLLSVGMFGYLVMQLRVELRAGRNDHFMEDEEWQMGKRQKIQATFNALNLYHLFYCGLLIVKWQALDPMIVNLLSSLLIQYLALTVKNQYIPMEPARYKA